MDALHAAAALTEREHRLRALEPGGNTCVALSLPDMITAVADVTAVFRQHRVPYALIGGLAVSVRSGEPHATANVDFAIPTTADRDALTAALEQRGFRLTGKFAHSINFEHTSGEPVQLAFDAGFDSIIARAELVRFGELELYVVTRDDLISMKRRSAADPARRRSKALRDQADIALLEGDVPEPDEGW